MTERLRRTSRAIAFGIALAMLLGFERGRALAEEISDTGRVSRSEITRLVRTCAPQVSAVTQSAIVVVESGGDAWALHDDNDGHVYLPESYGSAIALVGALLHRNRDAYGSKDRGVDVGLAQINSSNYASLGVTPYEMLDPCANLQASARIIVAAYLHERSLLTADSSWHGDQLALRRALQIYNSGRSSGDDAYVRAIFGAAGTHGPSPSIASRLPQSSVSYAKPSAVRRTHPRRGDSAEVDGRLGSALFVHVDAAQGIVSFDRREAGTQFAHAAAATTTDDAVPR